MMTDDDHHDCPCRYDDEILLAAPFSEAKIDVSAVRNWWFWLCCSVLVRVMTFFGVQMEQHLITVKQGKPKGQ